MASLLKFVEPFGSRKLSAATELSTAESDPRLLRGDAGSPAPQPAPGSDPAGQEAHLPVCGRQRKGKPRPPLPATNSPPSRPQEGDWPRSAGQDGRGSEDRSA